MTDDDARPDPIPPEPAPGDGGGGDGDRSAPRPLDAVFAPRAVAVIGASVPLVRDEAQAEPPAEPTSTPPEAI